MIRKSGKILMTNINVEREGGVQQGGGRSLSPVVLCLPSVSAPLALW